MRHLHLILVVVATTGCSANNVVFSGDGGALNDGGSSYLCDPAATTVDVLFVVDNSGSMAQEQEMLASAAQVFFTELAATANDFHVGIVTTDVNFSPLLECKGSCGNGMDCTQATSVSGAVQPGKSYCTMECEMDTDCPNYHCNSIGDCTPSACRKILGFDAGKKYCYPMNNGRLRYASCKSDACEYSGQHQSVLTSAGLGKLGADDFYAMFRDNVLVGTNGTGFEKGLQAMRNALDKQYADPVTGQNLVDNENAGFLRKDAALVLVIVSDEEDCSHDPLNPNFDEKKNTNDVCYPNPNTCHPDCQPREATGGCNPGEAATVAIADAEHVKGGISYCMIQCMNDADCQAASVTGLKCTAVDGFPSTVNYCSCSFESPTTNANSKYAYLTPVQEFVDFFKGLKQDQSMVRVGLITGIDASGAPKACASPHGVACAGTRYSSFAGAFGHHLNSSICESDLTPLVRNFAAELAKPCY